MKQGARGGRSRRGRRHLVASFAALVATASCVPVGQAGLAGASGPPALGYSALALSDRALSGLPAPFPDSHVFRARTTVDQIRALDCLAEAVYYEARSESEEGQRAVAQVVLNRVRHPAWPDSVCGVVYQGPLRPGGGCQFTFTCDGALAWSPAGPGWLRARRIAAEALAGRVFRPVGVATHYHTLAVSPDWAPHMAVANVIGAHIFYRQSNGLEPAAFTQAYAGHEPSRVFAAHATLPRLPAVPVPLPLPAWQPPGPVAALAEPAAAPADLSSSRLPQSRVRPEYRDSGRWKGDLG